ncbi:type II toxin-antitoxin system RelE/ParE family toxin [Enterococcus raffinosus]|uniref:type II toxin-antitoxin system RelE/ParE family toxin n=1 Tax=Enterococcus raffinosus TaxID=71452 RepID=UPI001C45098C|nr:type II toxin-antitoxin system RelE/ParE family toxin [Enterococcus raffinosus]QXJ58975.1 type II toxin-antitoxin system RelE/ParE family toxin [Enterococcus raffinosus]
MMNYTLVYSESFRKSLQENISEWEKELLLTDEKITQFVHAIYHSLNRLKQFPEMYENVAGLYDFDKPTYRILIGKSFAIFYRINQEERTILIGNLFKQKQMHLYF